MNCLQCQKHSLVLTCMYGFAKTELTCWAVKGGKVVLEEVDIHVVEAPEWCPLAKETEIK